jgi:hypothetical protein
MIIDNLCDPEIFQKIIYPIVKILEITCQQWFKPSANFFSKKKMKFGNWFVKSDVNNQMCLHLRELNPLKTS